jgi:hypothetical protein
MLKITDSEEQAPHRKCSILVVTLTTATNCRTLSVKQQNDRKIHEIYGNIFKDVKTVQFQYLHFASI